MAKKDRDPQAPTTVSTRVWCTADFEDIQTMLSHGGAAKLPPDLYALAEKAGATLSWPHWLTLGIGMKFFRRWLEEQLKTPTPEPEDENRRGMRPRRTEPVVSERELGLNEELEQIDIELKTAKGARKKELMKRRAEIVEQLEELKAPR